ncbi:MAG: DUF1345 domain-containing protein [Leptothrix sp. (in: b-proteobacteria)]
MHRPHHPHRLLRLLVARPRLWSSIAVGVAAYLALPEALVHHAEARVLLGWNACTLLYLGLALHMVRRSDSERMQRRALHQNEGRILVLTMVVVAAIAVLLAIGSQLSALKAMHGLTKTLHASLAAVTVLSSWLFTQTLFGLHYAHDFYAARVRSQPDVLQFPGTVDPTYGDFFYFAAVIGTSGQTADVAFTSSELRRIGVLHCILAFFFNTTVLALTINIAAGLF